VGTSLVGATTGVATGGACVGGEAVDRAQAANT